MVAALGLRSGAFPRHFDSLVDAYNDYGFATCFVFTFGQQGISRPQDYSSDTVTGILDEISEEDTAELESEIAGKSAELKPFDERIAALTAQIERHEELAAELRECNADIRAIERRKDDLVATAREKISPREAKGLILARWYRTLASTISAYVEAHLRSAIAAIENLHDKYTVPLGALLASRAESTAKLDGFLKELGYSLPEVR
jgi:DNA repair exonuclease SbcCD ATPase subunit